MSSQGNGKTIKIMSSQKKNLLCTKVIGVNVGCLKNVRLPCKSCSNPEVTPRMVEKKLDAVSFVTGA